MSIGNTWSCVLVSEVAYSRRGTLYIRKQFANEVIVVEGRGLSWCNGSRADEPYTSFEKQRESSTSLEVKDVKRAAHGNVQMEN